jgi:hypothetical protein
LIPADLRSRIRHLDDSWGDDYKRVAPPSRVFWECLEKEATTSTPKPTVITELGDDDLTAADIAEIEELERTRSDRAEFATGTTH